MGLSKNNELGRLGLWKFPLFTAVAAIPRALNPHSGIVLPHFFLTFSSSNSLFCALKNYPIYCSRRVLVTCSLILLLPFIICLAISLPFLSSTQPPSCHDINPIIPTLYTVHNSSFARPGHTKGLSSVDNGMEKWFDPRPRISSFLSPFFCQPFYNFILF